MKRYALRVLWYLRFPLLAIALLLAAALVLDGTSAQAAFAVGI